MKKRGVIMKDDEFDIFWIDESEDKMTELRDK